MAAQDGSDKIAALLKQACPPAAASPEFKAKLRQQLSEQAGALGTQVPKPLWQQPFIWIPAAAALAVAAALVIYFVAFPSTPPAVTTNDATGIQTITATLNGTLDSLGTASNVTVSFEWGTVSGTYAFTTADQSRTDDGDFSADLDGLTPGTTYYYRAKADGDGDPVYGGEESFATLTTAPWVTTKPASGLTTTSATLNGTLDNLGTADNVAVCFEWGTLSGTYASATAEQVRIGPGDFSADFGGLTPSTTYYYRAKADGDGAPVYGGEESFTTARLNLPPVAEASGPHRLDEGSKVTLNGSGVDPEGGVLTYAWDLDNDGAFEAPGATPDFYAADGPATPTVTIRVCDQFGLCATDTATVTVANVPPAVGAITAPAGPVQMNTVISCSANFTDPGILDTHSAVWAWGDGTTSQGSVEEKDGSGAVSGSHTYANPGRYTITLTVTDKDGGEGLAEVAVTVWFAKQLVPCDSAGNPVELFAPGQSVYVKGTGLEPNTAYRIWIQNNPVADGDALVSSEDPSGDGEKERELVTTDANGDFAPVAIWAIPRDWQVAYSTYDVVADKQKDGGSTGVYNSASDGLDSFTVVGIVAPIPEVSSIILIGAGLLLLGGWVVLSRRRVAAE